MVVEVCAAATEVCDDGACELAVTVVVCCCCCADVFCCCCELLVVDGALLLTGTATVPAAGVVLLVAVVTAAVTDGVVSEVDAPTGVVEFVGAVLEVAAAGRTAGAVASHRNARATFVRILVWVMFVVSIL